MQELDRQVPLMDEIDTKVSIFLIFSAAHVEFRVDMKYSLCFCTGGQGNF